MEENKEEVQTEEKTEEKKETVQTASREDIEKNKTMAILAYFLFFLPLLTDAKESKFAMFHANQSLVLLLAQIVVYVVGTIIPFLGWFIILPLGVIFLVVLWIMGIINAANGKMKELPLIGRIHILDK